MFLYDYTNKAFIKSFSLNFSFVRGENGKFILENFLLNNIQFNKVKTMNTIVQRLILEKSFIPFIINCCPIIELNDMSKIHIELTTENNIYNILEGKLNMFDLENNHTEHTLTNSQIKQIFTDVSGVINFISDIYCTNTLVCADMRALLDEEFEPLKFIKPYYKQWFSNEWLNIVNYLNFNKHKNENIKIAVIKSNEKLYFDKTTSADLETPEQGLQNTLSNIKLINTNINANIEQSLTIRETVDNVIKYEFCVDLKNNLDIVAYKLVDSEMVLLIVCEEFEKLAIKELKENGFTPLSPLENKLQQLT